MKKTLLLAAIAFASFANAQTPVFEEDWDGNGPGISAWTLIDVDGLTPAPAVSYITDAWSVVDKDGAQGNFGGPAGDHAAASTSWYTNPGTSNDWLISPEITLPESEISVLWQSKAQDPGYRDGYELRLAPNAGNTVEDFTVVLYSTPNDNAVWTDHAVSLAEYAGTTVRLAWVNNSTDMFVLLVDNISVEEFSMVAPSCVTLDLPVDGATDVDPGNAVFSWTPAEGDEIASYSFWLGDSPDALTNIGSLTATTTPVTGLDYSTTYYWSIIPTNTAGSPTGCSVYSFTTIPSPFDPYCGPLSYLIAEPISHVNFAGIDNASDPNGATSHEAYFDVTANVNPGETYPITLQGNTAGPYDTYFTVFIDWNQNGILNDLGEVYEVAEPLTNSTGADGLSVTMDITVPADAVAGETRMRIIKNYGSLQPDPCLSTTFGQAEDYNVIVGTMSVNDITASKFSVYPNPAKSVVNLKGFDAEKVRVYNMLGQEIRVNFSNNVVNIEKLPVGNYVLQAENAEGEVKTVKFIKK
ncbi:MAG: choice-of-anchor J domain-containing protein [Flavobacteriaceae bacterium]|nr:choice-of-anchor J domain-containing protein [Flavobacteriaceae bacterium]